MYPRAISKKEREVAKRDIKHFNSRTVPSIVSLTKLRLRLAKMPIEIAENREVMGVRTVIQGAFRNIGIQGVALRIGRATKATSNPINEDT